MGNLSSIIGGLLLASNVIIASGQSNTPIKDDNSNYLFCTSSNLESNTINNYVHVVKKNEEDGIKDIEKLVHTKKFEEAWVYLPKDEKWIEVGKDEYFKSEARLVESGLSSNLELHNKIIKDNDTIVFYHYHPAAVLNLSEEVKYVNQEIDDRNMKYQSLKNQVKSVLNDLEIFKKSHDADSLTDSLELTLKEIDSTSASILENIPDQICFKQTQIEDITELTNYSTFAVPSHNDINIFIQQAVSHENFHKDGDCSSKIVSPYGVTEFRLTDEGMSYFLDKSYEFVRDYSKKAHDKLNLPTFDDESKNPEVLVNKYLSGFDKKFFDVTFKYNGKR